MNMDVFQIRNLRDFLVLYNRISETCFKRCTTTFASRDLTSDEDECVKNCVEKHIHANHRIMEIFMEIQPLLVQKRMAEINNAQAALEANAQAEVQVQSQEKEQSESAGNMIQ